MEDGITIDELAHRAEVPSSTIRMYQTRGILPPPEIRGRVGYYSAAHLARLRIIERLQGRGFSLAAIRDLLDAWANGASLATILGAERELATLSEPAVLTPEDFAGLFADGEVDPVVVQRAVDLGLVSFSGTEVHTSSRAFVEAGRALATHRVPAAVAVDEYELLAADARRIAERFVGLFDRYVIGDRDPTPADLAALGETIATFRGLAGAAVQELVARALDDAAAEAIARRAPTPPLSPRS